MNRMLRRGSRDLVKFIASLNGELPKILEQDMAGIQGKGTGVESISHEVCAALQFVASVENSFKGKANLKNNLIVFDIGANIGNYSKEVLKQSPGCAIFAFEPSKSARKGFKENHKLEMNVKLESFGFDAKIHNTILYSNYPGSPIGSLSKRNLKHFKLDFDCKEKVKMDTLDNYCEMNGVIPHLLKIDVEGHELSVLLGSLTIIKKILVVQFEFGGCNIDSRNYFQDFYYLMKDNFIIYRILNNGIYELSNYKEIYEVFITVNYLAIRK
jgi:FkbM family methyltransferase